MKSNIHLEQKGITFDDVLLIPAYSEILPSTIDLRTMLTKNIQLKIPIASAAMDTVTEYKLATKIAQLGGIGFIHKNMSIEQQFDQIKMVKNYENGVIKNPITLETEQNLSDVKRIFQKFNISGLPVLNSNKELVGMVTNRDIKYLENELIPVKDFMTKKLITAPEGTNLEVAKKIFQQHKIEKLPIIDKDGMLTGLITSKDVDSLWGYPNACKDSSGQLRVGAAVGITQDTIDRVDALVEAGVDIVTLDSAHGHSKGVVEMLEKIKKKHSQLDIVAGNIVTQEAAQKLIDSGADALKVGVGPGSICTTRAIAGVGVPQITAILEVREVAYKYNIPVIADGGIRLSGDITKAIVAGADSVMLGGMLAGTLESPGEPFIYDGKRYKTYVGMGSLAAMARGSKDRYFQKDEENKKLVAEGVEGMVPLKGSLTDILHQICGGIRSGMGYCGTPNIKSLQEEGKFIPISPASLKESHPHNIVLTKEPFNYSHS